MSPPPPCTGGGRAFTRHWIWREEVVATADLAGGGEEVVTAKYLSGGGCTRSGVAVVPPVSVTRRA
jgi:hypothetical protein